MHWGNVIPQILYVHVSARPQIADFNGVDWNLFTDTKEAIAATDEMIAQNRMKFTHIDASKDVLTKIAPHLTSKFYYIHIEGVLYVVSAALQTVWSYAHTS